MRMLWHARAMGCHFETLIEPDLLSPTASFVLKEPKKARLWGGRFRTDTDPVMEKFNDSLRFDKCMWGEDIAGSKAYAKALQRAGIITKAETREICDGLKEVHDEWAAGKFEVVVSLFS